jgi:phospholipid transport system substrate-binding protein
MNLQKLSRITIAFFLFLLPPVSSAIDTSTPAAVVDELHTALLATMKKARELGYTGRYKALSPVVNKLFDFPSIAKTVVGRYWSKLDSHQRSLFIDTFTKLSTATYASRFDGFSGEQFKHVSDEPVRGGRMLVRTELIKSNGEAVRLDYVLHQTASRWLIINVIADGVSDLALKRADYTAILKDQGFDALIATLNKKIAQYETPGKSG